MSSTHLSLSYHLVFATKNREPIVHADWQSRLHEYLGGTVRGLGGVPLGTGGIEDHVHLLIGLKATHCLSDFVRELKRGSSRWVTESGLAKQFGWQAGRIHKPSFFTTIHCDAKTAPPNRVLSRRTHSVAGRKWR